MPHREVLKCSVYSKTEAIWYPGFGRPQRLAVAYALISQTVDPY